MKTALLRLAMGSGIDFSSTLLRLARDSGLDFSSILKIASFSGFAVAYRQGTADESVLEESFDQDIFFSGVPEYQPRDTDVIIDVGAHIGAFALLAASKVPRGAVYAIEACEDTLNFLRINTALNGMRRAMARSW